MDFFIIALAFIGLSLINITMFIVARNVTRKPLWCIYDHLFVVLPRHSHFVWESYIDALKGQKGGAGKLVR